MNEKLPDKVIVKAAGFPHCSGLGVMITFFMTVKNHYHVPTFLDVNFRSEIGKSEYLCQFDEQRKFSIMDYADPRTTYSGVIEARVMKKQDIEAALRAYEMFHSNFSFTEKYQEKLDNALRQLEKNQPHFDKITLIVEKVVSNE